MKVLLLRFFACLLFAASLASDSSARVLARDLAYSEFHHAAFRSNCFDFEPNHPQNKDLKAPAQSLVVNRPEAGRPPTPVVAEVAVANSQLAKRSLTKWRFLEDYRPYDLAVRDWKFGQFTQDVYAQAVQSSLAVSKWSLVSPHHARAHLADLLYRVEDFQCQASAEMKTMRWAATWSQAAVHGAFKVQKELVALTSECLQCVRPSTLQQPYFTQPMLVAYQSSDGKQFVLTMDQARQWGLVREFKPQPENVVSTPRLVPNKLYAALIARVSLYQYQALRLTRWLTELRIAFSTHAPELH